MRSAGGFGRAHYLLKCLISWGDMVGAEIELREYRKRDLDAIFRLDQACFSNEFRFDRESMRAFAEAKGAVSLIIEATEGEIIGFVIVQIERRAAGFWGYVVTLDVSVEYRRRGVAQGLLSEAEERTAIAGALWMELHVFTGNEGAIRFYESSGYKRVGVRRKFYGEAGLDAFVYRKDLKDIVTI